MKKNIIAVIPARGGSKRIPGKNYKKFNGEPIIERTIKKLKKSKIFNRIIVSTDSKKIASISRRCGAEIPFMRPKSLSGDYASGGSVISHSVRFLVKENYQFDYVCCVYAPNPFLQIADLKKGFYKIKSKKSNYVFSATLYQFPYFRSFTYLPKRGIKMLFKHNIKKRSQDIKKIFQTLSPSQLEWISLGSFRYRKPLKQIIKERHKNTRLFTGEHITSKDEKFRYLRPLRNQAYKNLRDRLKKHSANLNVYMCMETKEIWEGVTGEMPRSDEKLDKLFDF